MGLTVGPYKLYEVIAHCDLCARKGGNVWGVGQDGAVYVMPGYSESQAKSICLAMNAAHISGYQEGLNASCNRSPGPSLSLGEGEQGIPNSEAVDYIRYGEQICEDAARGIADVVDRRGGEVET